MALKITSDNFEQEVLASPVPVMVDFWATWCGPCRMIAPVVEKVATDTAEWAKVCKADVDECPDLAERYGIRNIPTLLFFKGGQVVDTIVGATSMENMVTKLRSLR